MTRATLKHVPFATALACALAAFAGGACAQATVSVQAGTPDATVAGQAGSDDAATRPASDTTCLRSTGSRIVASRNLRAEKDGKPQRCASAFGRSYTADDLQRTGHTDLADALRSLDPSIR